KPGTEEHALAERLYEELSEAGFDVVYDDRDAGPGEKFADAELLGVPLRVTVGRRTIGAGELEVQVRRGGGARPPPPPGAGAGAPGEGAGRPLPSRRLSGLDGSGPPPPETVAGAPLRPWTIPNFIGYVRLALIPVFLVVELSSDSGTEPLGAVLFAVIGWSD